jgi:hypothetical protein
MSVPIRSDCAQRTADVAAVREASLQSLRLRQHITSRESRDLIGSRIDFSPRMAGVA